MITPYDDSDLVYNWEEHRYTPTTDFIRRETGIDLVTGEILNATDDANPSTLGDRTLNDISAHLYSVLYSMTPNTNYAEFLLACDEECRVRLKRAFINELKFTLRNGDFWFTLKENDRANLISRDTISLFTRPLPNGVKVLYQGVYRVPLIKWREGY